MVYLVMPVDKDKIGLNCSDTVDDVVNFKVDYLFSRI